MLDRHANDTPTAVLRAKPTADRTPPPWIAEAVSQLRFWKTSGLLEALRSIHWDRPAKRYELIDLVLVLLIASVSNARSLRALYKELDEHANALAAVWGRTSLPSRAQASALLRTVPANVVANIPLLLSSRFGRCS
jgi:hypothetical protein